MLAQQPQKIGNLILAQKTTNYTQLERSLYGLIHVFMNSIIG
jgi:hypothetical protein